MSLYPWYHMPHDLQLRILSQLPFDFLLLNQHLFTHAAAQTIHLRIIDLTLLHRKWVHSPIEIRNVPRFRTISSRMLCDPLSFVSLERLVLGTSRLHALPSAIKELTSLKVLHLDDNLLTSLPDEIVQCKSLLLIDCTHNRFRTFPEQLLRMPTLRHVIFAHNPLTSLPSGIADLPFLNSLSFYDCRLIDLPVQLVIKVASSSSFSLNIARNRFRKGYIRHIIEEWPTLRRQLQYVLVEESNR